MLAQEIAEVFRQEAVDRIGVGEDRNLAKQTTGIGRQVGVHLFELGEYLAGVAEQRFACRRRQQATRMAGKERHAERRFKLRQAMAGRRGRQMNQRSSPGQAARIGNGRDQAQVGQVVAHGFVSIECWF